MMRLVFGKYKGRTISEVPKSYLLWAFNNNYFRGKWKNIVRDHLNIVDTSKLNTYKVTVEDSLGQDGEYIVKARSTNKAANKVRREQKVQSTQSYCGTSIRVKLID